MSEEFISKWQWKVIIVGVITLELYKALNDDWMITKSIPTGNNVHYILKKLKDER